MYKIPSDTFFFEIRPTEGLFVSSFDSSVFVFIILFLPMCQFCPRAQRLAAKLSTQHIFYQSIPPKKLSERQFFTSILVKLLNINFGIIYFVKYVLGKSLTTAFLSRRRKKCM